MSPSPTASRARTRDSSLPPAGLIPAGRQLARREIVTFVLPAFDPADHLFDLPGKTRQIGGAPISAVAVRSVAIHHKERVGWVRAQVSLIDSSMRQIDRA